MAVLALWRAVDRDLDRWTLAAAITIGAGVLTKFTFIAFIPVLACVLVVRWWPARTRQRAAVLAATLLVPLAMVSPWLLWNHHTYGTWTAIEQARTAQAPIINPTNADYHLNKVVNEAHVALDASVMQGWETVGHQDLPSYLKWSLLVTVFALPALMLTRTAGHDEWRRRIVLGVPIVMSFAMVAYITVVEDWGVMTFRYLRPAMPAWFLFAYLTWQRVTRSPVVATRIAFVAFVGLAALWWADARMYLV